MNEEQYLHAILSGSNIGYEEILSGGGGGFGYEEILSGLPQDAQLLIGALPPAQKAAVAQALVNRNAVAVRHQAMTKGFGNAILPLVTLAVLTTATGTATQTPQSSFEIGRFFIDSANAPDWLITSIKVGPEDIFAAAGGVRAQLFSEVNILPIRWGTASNGREVQVGFQNVSLATADFRAMFTGTYVK